MSWTFFAFITVLLYAVFDLLVKLSADKLHGGLSGFIINLVATVVLFLYFLFSKMRGEDVFAIKPYGIAFSVLAGVVVGVATITFLKMFATGVNLSVGVPVVRIGIVVLASILGITILREGVSGKYVLGFLVSLFGLYLLLTAN